MTQSLPLFPLQTVLFPGASLSLRIFETRYLDMVRECVRQSSSFGVCLLVKGDETDAEPTAAQTGTTARVADFFTMEDGLLGIRAEGVQRFRAHAASARDNGLLVVEPEYLSDETAPMPSSRRSLSQVLQHILEHLEEENQPAPTEWKLDDASWVSYRLADLLPMPLLIKQNLLETDDPAERLEIIHRVLPQLSKQ